MTKRGRPRKLTPEQVAHIKTFEFPMWRYAELYGVSIATVYKALHAEDPDKQPDNG